MPREPSPKRFQALKIWLKHSREIKLKEIAEELGVSDSQVRKWKCIDKWDEIPESEPNKRGAPYRNRNAVGNKGGGAPEGNQNALKHGMFKKWLPDDDELHEIYEAVREGMSTLDILYEEILVMFTNFIRAQKIMYVKDQNDMTKELKKEKVFKEAVEVEDEHGNIKTEYIETSGEREYEIQFAWDKQATALRSQAAAMRAIGSKIKQYEELIRTLPPDEVQEHHRLKLSKLKVDIEKAQKEDW